MQCAALVIQYLDTWCQLHNKAAILFILTCLVIGPSISRVLPPIGLDVLYAFSAQSLNTCGLSDKLVCITYLSWNTVQWVPCQSHSLGTRQNYPLSRIFLYSEHTFLLYKKWGIYSQTLLVSTWVSEYSWIVSTYYSVPTSCNTIESTLDNKYLY